MRAWAKQTLPYVSVQCTLELPERRSISQYVSTLKTHISSDTTIPLSGINPIDIFLYVQQIYV